MVFWFNLKGGLLRDRHAVSCKDSIELGLIPFPLHPLLHVFFHDKCWTKIFDALTPVMLALLACLVCGNFFLMFFELCIIFLRFPILIILISLKLGLHLDAPSSTTTILLPLPGNISPQLEILTGTIGLPWSIVDNRSIFFSTSIPSTTLPNKTCLLQIIRKGTLIIWE